MIGVPAYVAREAAISSVINAAISAAFFLVVFGFGATVPVWGLGNFVLDLVPQTFAVVFFASFVPSLLANRAISAGKIAAVSIAPAAALTVFKTAVVQATAAVIVGVAIWAAFLWLAGTQEITATTAFAIKVIYGALLGASVTFNRLRAMLA